MNKGPKGSRSTRYTETISSTVQVTAHCPNHVSATETIVGNKFD